jgi:hypothetical protein
LQVRPRRPAAGPIGAETAHAMAEAVLRAGLALVTIVAATDCIFALVAGGGPPAAVEGAVLTGLGLAAVVRVDVATRVLRRRGRVVLVAAAFAAGGILDAGLQDHFAEVAAAFTCVAALICAPRWVALCWLVCAAGFLGALAEEGHSIAWMVGDGRYAARDRSSTSRRTPSSAC